MSLVNWVKSNCGINRVETVYIDSVASWDDVGNIVGMNGENAQLAYTEGNKDVARRGGNVAGVARKETEKELGHSVISSENFLNLDEKSNGTLPENNLPE